MRSALLLTVALALAAPAPAGGPAAPAVPLGPVPPAELKPNTWTPVKIDAPLPADLKGARWETTDGFSYSVYRAKTGTVLLRTGIDCKAAGYCPGYYTNTTVEWDPVTDKGTVVEIAAWGGGSYGKGKLLPAFKENPTPSPRHTYDSICYVGEEDAVYMMHGANWKTCLGEGVPQDAKDALQLDHNSVWKYSFAEKKWTRIDGSVRQFWNEYRASNFEAHMRHWPAGGRLLYFNSGANCHAEFDLKTKKWEKIELKGKSPMSLYEARSAWDAKRGLWVFRHGPQACTYNPATREFAALPELYPMPNPAPKDEKDPRRGCQGIAYNSKHDVYFASGPTGDDTYVLEPGKSAWTNLKCGDVKLGSWRYLQYDPKTDVTVLSTHLAAFKFRYVPEKPAAGGEGK